MFIYLYYQQNIKPNRYTDDPKSDYDIKRETDIHKKLPGKDMYDVLRRYRKRNYTLRVCAIIFCCFLIIGIFLVKMSGEMHIDYRISIGVAVVVLLLSFGIAGRKEFSYSRELDFKKAVHKSEADPVRLNADFMMGSHFYLRDGLVVLGRDYLVIFAKSLCEVLETNDIALVVKETITQEIQGSKLVLYRLKITQNNGNYLQMGLRDEKETDLMLNELRLLNIPYEIEPETEIK